MTLQNILKNKSSAEKNDIKIKELIKSKVKTFNRKGFDIEILELSQEDNRLKVIVKAKKDGVELFVDNPLYFLNPPILVPDGTKRIVYDEDSNPIQVDNLKEDLDEVLQEIIAECLRVTIK